MARFKITVEDLEGVEPLQEYPDCQGYILATVDQPGRGICKWHAWPMLLLEVGAKVVQGGIEMLGEESKAAVATKKGEK